jgi:hypothetical protein
MNIVTGTCYERVEMADGVIRMCLCSYEYHNGELRITGIVRVIG